MNAALVSSAIETRITGDTGAGGLYETNDRLINGVYFDIEDAGAAAPYVVVTFPEVAEDDTFPTDAVDMVVQFEVVTDRRSGTFANDAEVLGRLKTRFHRWAMTLTGYSATAMRRVTGSTAHDNEFRRYIETYAVRVEEA